MGDLCRFARRPPNAFLIFCKKNRPIARKHNPNVENRQITKILGDWWAHLDDVQKSYYKKLSNENKDKFFKKHPDFQWYKLPAPPLHRLRTRPSNMKFKKEEQFIKSETINPGKLADESQLGGLSSLITPPKPPNKRYLQLNYFESEKTPSESSISYNKNLISFDVTSVEVKEEPLELKEGEVDVKVTGKLDVGEKVDFKDNHSMEVSEHDNKTSIISNKENSLSFSSNTFETSQQKIIDCVVDNSFKNENKFLISDYHCSTNSDFSYCHKLADKYSGTNGILDNDTFCEDKLMLNRSNATENAIGHRPQSFTIIGYDLDGLKAADCITKGLREKNNNEENNPVEMYGTVKSKPDGSKNGVLSNNILKNDSNLKVALSYNPVVNTKVVAQEILSSTCCNGDQYRQCMCFCLMNVDRAREMGRRQSERLRRRNGLVDNENLQIKMEEDFGAENSLKADNLHFKEDIFHYSKVKSENSSEFELEHNACDGGLLDSEIKYESKVHFKCEEKFFPSDYFIDLEFEKEIEELPKLSYEEYQHKKKEEQQLKKQKKKKSGPLMSIRLDHDYFRSSRNRRPSTAAMPQVDYNNNVNNNYTRNSGDQSNEVKYLFKKRSAFRRHSNNRNTRGFPKATASIWNESLIKVENPSAARDQPPQYATQGSPSVTASLWNEQIMIGGKTSHYDQRPLQATIGRREREAVNGKIKNLEPRSRYKYTSSATREAAMTLIAFSDAAYREMNLPSRFTKLQA